MREEGPFYFTNVVTVFELLIWLGCLYLVCKDADEKRLSVKMPYRTGNIVGLVVKTFVAECIDLFVVSGQRPK